MRTRGCDIIMITLRVDVDLPVAEESTLANYAGYLSLVIPGES